MPIKAILGVTAAALAIAIPALAQQPAQQSNPPQPAANQYPGGGIGAQPPATSTPAQSTPVTSVPAGGDESAVEEVSALNLQPAAPVVEYPGWARRDVWTVGSLNPTEAGVGDDAFGTADGAFLSTLMRRMDDRLRVRHLDVEFGAEHP